jgi:hypothetical protein
MPGHALLVVNTSIAYSEGESYRLTGLDAVPILKELLALLAFIVGCLKLPPNTLFLSAAFSGGPVLLALRLRFNLLGLGEPTFVVLSYIGVYIGFGAY